MQDDDQISALQKKIEKLLLELERTRIAEYVEMLHNPGRLLWSNFIAGLARGLGTAVGFTLLGALLVYFLQRIVVWNLPLISDFIAQLIEMVLERTYY